MDKFLNIVVFSAVLVSSVVANTHQSVYVGASVGYRNGIYNTKSHVAANNRSAGSANVAGGSILGGLSVAYLHEAASSAYLGLELAADFHPQRAKTEFPDDQVNAPIMWKLKTTSRFSYSGALIAGFAFDKVLPYLKVGVVGTQIQVKGHRTPNAAVGIVSRDFKASKRPFGVLAGLGVIFPVSDSFYLGTEYTYAHYVKNIKMIDGPADATSRGFRIRPTSHSFKIKLAYKF